MSSDVCKHCTHAACLDVCPTGSLFRTEFGTVVVQPDICNGCGYCVPACPYGVIDLRKDDGRAFKCTLCYDRLKDGQTPACAQACPTESIQFGELDELRERADPRVAELHEQGCRRGPALRRATPTTASAATAPSSCCSTSPRSTACRPTRSSRPATSARSGSTSARPPRALAAVGVGVVRRDGGDEPAWSERRRWCRSRSSSPTTAGRSSRPRPGRRPTSRSTCSSAAWPAPRRVLAEGAALTGRPGLERVARLAAAAGAGAGTVFLVHDLGRPERFLNMLRVFKLTSPLSVGSFILAPFSALSVGGGRLQPDRPAAPAGPAGRARGRRVRPAAGDLHRRAARQHRRARLARGAPRAAVRLRRLRAPRRRRAGAWSLAPVAQSRPGPADGGRRCRRSRSPPPSCSSGGWAWWPSPTSRAARAADDVPRRGDDARPRRRCRARPAGPALRLGAGRCDVRRRARC